MDKDAKIRLYSMTVDSNNPQQLAEFYAALLGWGIPFQDEDYVVLAPPGVSQGAWPGITIQHNPDYVPPVWPAAPGAQQTMAHMDFAVADLDKAVAHALQCGAKEAGQQFSAGWKVMLDPAGHPFCLVAMPHIFAAGE